MCTLDLWGLFLGHEELNIRTLVTLAESDIRPQLQVQCTSSTSQ